MMRFSEDSATQLPARRWRGRVAGLGRAGRSGRPSRASPWPAQADFPGWSGGVLGKVGTAPAWPALGNPRSPVAPGGVVSRAAEPAPPGAQNSWGSQRAPKRVGAGSSLCSWDLRGHDRVRFCLGSGKSPWDSGSEFGERRVQVHRGPPMPGFGLSRLLAPAGGPLL